MSDATANQAQHTLSATTNSIPRLSVDLISGLRQLHYCLLSLHSCTMPIEIRRTINRYGWQNVNTSGKVQIRQTEYYIHQDTTSCTWNIVCSIGYTLWNSRQKRQTTHGKDNANSQGKRRDKTTKKWNTSTRKKCRWLCVELGHHTTGSLTEVNGAVTHGIKPSGALYSRLV